MSRSCRRPGTAPACTSANSRIERLDSPQAVERWREFWKGELAGL